MTSVAERVGAEKMAVEKGVREGVAYAKMGFLSEIGPRPVFGTVFHVVQLGCVNRPPPPPPLHAHVQFGTRAIWPTFGIFHSVRIQVRVSRECKPVRNLGLLHPTKSEGYHKARSAYERNTPS